MRLVGTSPDKASVLSVVLAGYSTDEVGRTLNQEGIAVRTGHHCAQPILRRTDLRVDRTRTWLAGPEAGRLRRTPVASRAGILAFSLLATPPAMHSNPYRPPTTTVADGVQASSPLVWVARVLAAICFITGIVRIAGIAISVAKSDIGLTTLYVNCAGSMLWCVLGCLIFVRSRYALPAAVIAIVVPYLLSPIAGRLVRSDLGVAATHFDYWNDVRMQLQATGVDWILYAVILLYTGWDYRERFASWRRE